MVVPALFLLFLIISWLLNKQLRNIGEFKKIATSICALILGITLAWSPWLIRSYLLYGKPCFFNTSETFAFFWDLRGAIRLNDGKIIPISSIRKIKDPKNDYEFSKYGDSLIKQ